MRVKLCDKYKIEREDICTKIIDILKLDANNSFLLSDLDADTEKQMAILNMKEEIQKCFACSEISSFKPNFECKRPYLNIVRGILRKQNYLFNGISIVIKLENGDSNTTKKYYIFRNNYWSHQFFQLCFCFFFNNIIIILYLFHPVFLNFLSVNIVFL